MPESQQPAEGQRIMLAMILEDTDRAVIDVGAGTGKWGRLLVGKMRRIAGLEVWGPYVEKHRLADHYDELIICDARRFTAWAEYQVVILGDVLEHMPRRDATALVRALREAGPQVFLTVPVTPCIVDGSVYGNPYETHVDQWTNGELVDQGWLRLHLGPNPNGLVQVGTYVLGREGRHGPVRDEQGAVAH